MRVGQQTWGWIGPIGIALLAFVLRIWDVARPNRLMFDETYYAKDAWSMLQVGYAQDFVEDANDKIVAGDLSGLMTGDPSWVVHPPAGHLLIAAGESMFGLDPFGWRIAAVVIGSLTVLVLARLVRRLTGSTVIGMLAGLLLAFDGMHFVLSRVALLDVFLAFWILVGVACLVADHDHAMAAEKLRGWWRPWQLAAGVSFGLAVATKWSGLYSLAAFGLLVVVWEVWARRAGWWSLLRTGIPAFGWIVVVALGVYLLTWTGWLVNHEIYEARFGYGYGDYSAPWGTYLDRTPTGFLGETRDAFRSLWHYHQMTYEFHTGGLDTASHPYQSNPLGWLVLERPVGVDAQNDLAAATCGAAADSSCIRVVTILGNPAVWWTGVAVTLAAAFAWIRTRDGRWAVPVVGVLSGWLPWFANADRPIFSFYAVTVLPFMIVAIAMVVSALYQRSATARGRYVVGALSGGLVVTTIGLFWWFHPILTDQLISYDSWFSRMWFSRWI
ncbi:dolichyl-phosphate-mannose--protein mannosyltransferase [Aeromicrobium sp. CF3.5]|uniref:dolichyl-phosphate-mannose--protein mannosyltransferase n=1 Tax=Aeromicrobium sp. CF3.5 TaxID=3373078 RepID=UPI003EE430F7